MDFNNCPIFFLIFITPDKKRLKTEGKKCHTKTMMNRKVDKTLKGTSRRRKKDEDFDQILKPHRDLKINYVSGFIIQVRCLTVSVQK